MKAERLEFEFDLATCRDSDFECSITQRSALCDGAIIEAILAGLRHCGAPDSGIAPALGGGAMSVGAIAPALGGGAMAVGAIAPALGGGAMSVAISSLELHCPLWIESDRTAALILDVESTRFELHSKASDPRASGRTRLHAVGHAGVASSPVVVRAPVAMSGLHAVDGAEFYAALAHAGRSWSAGLHLIEQLAERGGSADARLREGALPGSEGAGFVLHPAVLEAALQLVAFLALRRDETASRLMRVDSICVLRNAPVARILVQPVEDACAADAGWRAFVLDAGGGLIAHLDGVRFETADRQHRLGVDAHAARILELARGALGVADLDETSDLVAWGASSLDLIRLLSTLRSELGWAPPIDRLLLQPTAIAIARCFLAEDAHAEEALVVSAGERAQARGGAGTAIVSHSEQRLWYLERFGHVSPAYNETVAWRIDGDLEVEALAQSLAQVVSRHDILRTSFPEVDGLPHRSVTGDSDVALGLVDLSSTDPEPALARALMEETRRRFALDSGPLLRATLFVLGPQRHVLLIAAHHVVCDGWSVGLLSAELQECYRALRDGRAPHVTARPLQMAEYASWEQHRAPERLEALLDWWVAELADAPTLLELPGDRPRPRVQAHRGDRVAFELEPAITQALRAFARELGATPFAVAFAAFQVLIHRHTGQNQFLIGVPLSLRDDPELESVLGCLVNTVPIRAELAADMSLLDVVGRTRIRVARALARKDAPLDQIVARLRCDRSLSRTPLVQVAFSYHEAQATAFALPGCSVRPIEVEGATAKFDLMLQLSDHGDRMIGHVEYAADLFDAPRMEQMTGHFRRILTQLVRNPGVEIGGDWLFGDAQRNELTQLGSGPTVAPGGDLLASIDFHLQHGNARLAVVCGREQLNYGELASEVARVSALLATQIDEGDAPIALCAGRSCAWVVGVLSILRLGRAYLPIDPQTPRKRALHALFDSGVRVLLYADADCNWAGEFSGTAVELGARALGATDIAPPRSAGAMPLPEVGSQRADFDPERMFYAITTSGSTGTPKTAAVSYGAFANLHDWYCDALAIDERARVLVATSVAFDLTQKNLFAALARGARLVLRSEGTFDPIEVRDLIEAHEVTVINCTPSLFYPLIDRADEACHARLSSLRHVVLGGETIDLAKLKPWLDRPSCRAQVINSYGPTECTDVCAVYELDPRAPAEAIVPIGRPIPNVTLHVLDAARRAVPLGVAGELYIAGRGLGQGYLGGRGSGQRAFVQLASGPAYRTGDLVRYRWDGQLEFLGRIDNQVKVRGHRVNLEEIEAALRKHRSVIEAAVVTRGTGEVASALNAYYVADRDLEMGELRSWLADLLPRYMVPSSFTRIAQLPLTRSGKLDRLRLPEPNGVTQRPPRGALELGLHELWRDLLGVGELGVDDDFFDVGGHSLLAIRLAEEVELRLQRVCRVADVFERPTIKELAELLDRRQPELDAPRLAG